MGQGKRCRALQTIRMNGWSRRGLIPAPWCMKDLLLILFFRGAGRGNCSLRAFRPASLGQDLIYLPLSRALRFLTHWRFSLLVMHHPYIYLYRRCFREKKTNASLLVIISLADFLENLRSLRPWFRLYRHKNLALGPRGAVKKGLKKDWSLRVFSNELKSVWRHSPSSVEKTTLWLVGETD
jgi:hypothetical protein